MRAELERCARLCEETAQRYVERHGEGAATDVMPPLLLAAAALDSAADGGETARLIARTLAAEARAALERLDDEDVRPCLDALRRAGELLGSG